jgi:DNA/RNA-binding domain of Phe-tRNA-synthetase-like protein
MPDVTVAPEVAARFPDYVALVLFVHGIGNGAGDEASERGLVEAEASLRARGLAVAKDHPHIAAWRAAFGAFGAKPSRFPCSAEALASRVLKGGELPRVNLLVDLYNAVSVRHLIPLGGEDADRLEGPLRLAVATGDEAFDGADGAPAPGEIVWRDDAGVTCRRWNWRQGARTRLTESTRNAFFVFDRLDGVEPDELHAAADELAAELRRRWPQARLETVVRSAGA